MFLQVSVNAHDPVISMYKTITVENGIISDKSTLQVATVLFPRVPPLVYLHKGSCRIFWRFS